MEDGSPGYFDNTAPQTCKDIFKFHPNGIGYFSTMNTGTASEGGRLFLL
jgi:hypothetical protein